MPTIVKKNISRYFRDYVTIGRNMFAWRIRNPEDPDGVAPDRDGCVAGNDIGSIDYSQAHKGIAVFTVDPSTVQDCVAVAECRPDFGEFMTCRTAYALEKGKPFAVPLNRGTGDYVLRIEDASGVTLLEDKISVQMDSDLAPYLASNGDIDWAAAIALRTKVEMLIGECVDDTDKTNVIYEWAMDNLRPSGSMAYGVPMDVNGCIACAKDLDGILANKAADTADLAAIIVGMLRCAGVPARVVRGTYAGDPCHWVSVWHETNHRIRSHIVISVGAWVGLDTLAGPPSTIEPHDLTYKAESYK